MTENPFLKTAESTAETTAETAPVVLKVAPETPASEETDAGTPPADELFEAGEPDADDPIADADADPDEAAADDDLVEEPKAKKVPETVPYKRLSKVVDERNTARKEVEKLTERVDTLMETHSAVFEVYKDFKDPVNQVRYDAGFMAALEALNKGGFKGMDALVTAANHYMKTGEIMSAPNSGTAAKAPTAEADPRLDAIVARDARRTITEALPENIRGGFKSVFTDYVLGTHDDLASLTPSQVTALAKDFIKEKGFVRDEVYTAAAAKADLSKPATGGGKGPVAGTRKAAATPKKGAEADAGPEKPKDLDEWNKNRRAMIDSLFAG